MGPFSFIDALNARGSAHDRADKMMSVRMPSSKNDSEFRGIGSAGHKPTTCERASQNQRWFRMLTALAEDPLSW
jgi:hypothetical protein